MFKEEQNPLGSPGELLHFCSAASPVGKDYPGDPPVKLNVSGFFLAESGNRACIQ
jgi:hypothetical protein